MHGPLAVRCIWSVIVYSGYGPWCAWSSCSKTCMVCCSEQWPLRECPLAVRNVLSVAVNGGYGPWSAWSSCTKTCEVGAQSRSRQCNDPVPDLDGLPCVRPSSETQDCNKDKCPGIAGCQNTPELDNQINTVFEWKQIKHFNVVFNSQLYLQPNVQISVHIWRLCILNSVLTFSFF